MSARLRHCGRFAYWQVPLGPWRCSQCERAWWPDEPGPGVPRSHEARYLAAAQALADGVPPLTPEQEALLDLFETNAQRYGVGER